MPGPSCQLCQSTNIRKTKRFRLGTAGQILGVLCLIPGIIMLCLGIYGCVGSVNAAGSASEQSTQQSNEVRRQLEQGLASAGIPPAVIAKVKEPDYLPDDYTLPEGLSLEQKEAIRAADDQFMAEDIGEGASQAGAAIGGALAGGISLGLALAGLVLCCIGALFRLRKRVLQCADCEAILATA